MVFVLLQSSAGVYAGSLAPACQILGILANRSPDYGARGYFGVLENLGTILGRSWDIWEHKEAHCEVQARILLIFGLGPFKEFFGYLRTEKNICSYLFLGCFF